MPSIRTLLLWVSLLVPGILLGGVRHARAQDAARPVVMAMESSLGVGGAAKVRAQLRRQSGVPVLSPSEAHAHGVRLGIVLVVELDRGQKVTVVYLDERGTSDVLSAPVAADSPDVTGIVATLAAALLQRHPASAPVGEGSGEGGRSTREASIELASASRALYAALGRMGVLQRRTGRLSAEDF
jgi:hypothetical protein